LDFFIHDLLDFSVLNKNEQNFTKINSVFDIREAVQQIIQMQTDKISMKQIRLEEKYPGFKAQ
jgi:ribosomal 30S subunit maturation factor RimM